MSKAVAKKADLLADGLRDLLLKPPNMEVGRIIRRQRSREPEQYQYLLWTTKHAHRYVLQDDFTEAAARFSASPPDVLLKAMDFARMPFSSLWIEWNDTVRRAHSPDGSRVDPGAVPKLPTRRGLLMTVKDKMEDLVIVHVQPVMGGIPQDPGLTVLNNMAFELYFLDDALQYGRAQREIAISSGAEHNATGVMQHLVRAPMGQEYLLQHSEASKEATQDLADRASVTSSLLFSESWGALGAGDEGIYRDVLMELNLTSGDARFALAVLTLLTDSPTTTLRFTSMGGGGTTFRVGKFLPKYEYKMLTITRPAGDRVIDLTRVVGQYLPWAGTRLHTVEGHWCYSHRHGRSNCEHSNWRRHVDDDGQPVGKDMWQCTLCGKYRWWRDPHLRGNPEIGVLDKGYEVRGARV